MKTRSSWDCWNLKICRELRKQPLAIPLAGVSVLLSGIIGAMAVSMWSYIVSVGSAPGEIRVIKTELAAIHKTVDLIRAQLEQR